MSDEQPASPELSRPHLSLRTSEPTSFGYGWISGVLSVAFGALGLGAVLCFHFPSWLTVEPLRGLYPVPYIRALLHLVLVASFLLGTTSVCLRYNKALGLTGISLTLAAALLGGAQVPLDDELNSGPYLGLDWFLLNLILYSLVYVPLERAFARRAEQRVFRDEWQTDLTYFFVNTLLIQFTSLMTVMPAMTLFNWARNDVLTAWTSSWPMAVQVVAVLLVADLTQYWVHRAFHELPWLWRFHAIHHSATNLDWLAGSRLHLVDALLTRAATYIPIYILGFSQRAIIIYIVIVAVQATFIHANVRWKLRPFRRLVATPHFHHWHHSAEREAINKNFAVHTPVWDLLFGTYYLPDRWPGEYGLAHNADVPKGWLRQLLRPFRRSHRVRRELD
jgi:sterol desaturase/sphingolipid hydroxylase (fatty acid hydroxylase superfamily)